MLKLPDVTLVMVDTRYHDLAKLAVTDCMNKAEFGDVLIFSDKCFNIPGTVHIDVENWPDIFGWNDCIWYRLPTIVQTSHALLIQWDAGIFDPDCWMPQFLNYDYIGAPWWHTDGLNVGNSGFNLRSLSLMKHLLKHRDKYPHNHPEDMRLSRDFRPALEGEGFVWAPQEVALDFSFECIRWTPSSRHFGYHDIRNWPLVFNVDELNERFALAARMPELVKSGKLQQVGIHPVCVVGYKPDGNWKLVEERLSGHLW